MRDWEFAVESESERTFQGEHWRLLLPICRSSMGPGRGYTRYDDFRLGPRAKRECTEGDAS